MPPASLIIPFREDDGTRGPNLDWLLKRWRAALPDFQIVVGEDDGRPFSKSAAVNEGASRARGRALVVIDADCYADPAMIRSCAYRTLIDGSWFVPYEHLFRLTREKSEELRASDPAHPLKLYPLAREDWEESATNEFGAMLQIYSREAFDLVGGWDERFRGWGGEDHAVMRALDTLHRPHRTTRNYIYSLWHTRPGKTPHTRVWEGQRAPRSNYALIARYRRATDRPDRMLRLLKERDEARSAAQAAH